uniref:Uncharacterized protein n=1 Tax=Romanomermis culicivorax TaxID=13658 RepID=A0A915KIX6_ROMCU
MKRHQLSFVSMDFEEIVCLSQHHEKLIPFLQENNLLIPNEDFPVVSFDRKFASRTVDPNRAFESRCTVELEKIYSIILDPFHQMNRLLQDGLIVWRLNFSFCSPTNLLADYWRQIGYSVLQMKPSFERDGQSLFVVEPEKVFY